jgi:putative tricarboxylic transport membrane protein
MMKSRDLFSSLFWVAVASLFCVAAVKYGLFRAGIPGSGLFPFIAGTSLIILSILALGASFFNQEKMGEERRSFFPYPDSCKRVIFSACALFAYPILLHPAGYLITTFLFVLFILAVIVRQKILIAITAALFTTALFYVVFIIILGVRLPKGFLGF